ncbi:DUF4145 domain-containing protein [Streptomyces xanthochromogenes]|uniref:DUF4145 domain-containing protein n=1 Tax=Streptomyces xanthochromogenes TaxID=67384 RepID=UPI00344ACAF9
MASTTCGWCGRLTHMTMVGGLYEAPRSYGNKIYAAAFVCDNEECRRLSLGQGMLPREVLRRPDSEIHQHFTSGPLSWVPNRVMWPGYSDVPKEIGKTAGEAHACLSVQAFRGAVALARAVVEATAKDKGCTSGNLVAKIDALASAGHLRQDTAELAHEIRHGGNEIAHGDLTGEPMPSEDAEAIVSFMDEVLQEVYQGPAKVARLRADREARKARNAAS